MYIPNSGIDIKEILQDRAEQYFATLKTNIEIIQRATYRAELRLNNGEMIKKFFANLNLTNLKKLIKF